MATVCPKGGPRGTPWGHSVGPPSSSPCAEPLSAPGHPSCTLLSWGRWGGGVPPWPWPPGSAGGTRTQASRPSALGPPGHRVSKPGWKRVRGGVETQEGAVGQSPGELGPTFAAVGTHLPVLCPCHSCDHPSHGGTSPTKRWRNGSRHGGVTASLSDSIPPLPQPYSSNKIRNSGPPRGPPRRSRGLR